MLKTFKKPILFLVLFWSVGSTVVYAKGSKNIGLKEALKAVTAEKIDEDGSDTTAKQISEIINLKKEIGRYLSQTSPREANQKNLTDKLKKICVIDPDFEVGEVAPVPDGGALVKDRRVYGAGYLSLKGARGKDGGVLFHTITWNFYTLDENPNCFFFEIEGDVGCSGGTFLYGFQISNGKWLKVYENEDIQSFANGGPVNYEIEGFQSGGKQYYLMTHGFAQCQSKFQSMEYSVFEQSANNIWFKKIYGPTLQAIIEEELADDKVSTFETFSEKDGIAIKFIGDEDTLMNYFWETIHIKVVDGKIDQTIEMRNAAGQIATPSQ